MPNTKAKNECNKRWALANKDKIRELSRPLSKKYYNANKQMILEKARNRYHMKKEWEILLSIEIY